jgi:hypothetical protein
MATGLHLVRRNFRYQLEQITPTYTGIARAFLGLDRVRAIQPGNSSGQARDFIVKRLGAAEDIEPTCKAARFAWHDYQLDVYYPEAIGLEHDLDDVIEQDRHDVIERLRAGAYRVGYDASHTTTDVGLQHRYRVTDEIDDSGDVWVVTYLWRCQIMEGCT